MIGQINAQYGERAALGQAFRRGTLRRPNIEGLPTTHPRILGRELYASTCVRVAYMEFALRHEPLDCQPGLAELLVSISYREAVAAEAAETGMSDHTI